MSLRLSTGCPVVRLVVPDLDRVVRPGTVLRVQHQQVGDISRLSAGIDLPRGTPSVFLSFHSISIGN